MNIDYAKFEKIFETIAEKNNRIAEEIKREMQLAIDLMWESKNPEPRALFPKGKPGLIEFLVTVKNDKY